MVHLGGDTFNAQTKISSSKRENAVLSVGAINALKGYEFIVQSLGTINEDERPMFIIVGNASNKIYLSKIQSLADKLNVSLSIHENISDEDLTNLIYEIIRLWPPFFGGLRVAQLDFHFGPYCVPKGKYFF